MIIKHESFYNIVQKDFGQYFSMMASAGNFDNICKQINLISRKSLEYGYSDQNIEEDVKLGTMKFAGDLFEIFAEVFFLIYGKDNRVGVYDYLPVPAEDDNGVDGYGKNIEGGPCTVQVKFRNNPTYELKERDIKQFGLKSITDFNVDYNRQESMVIFTNCAGLHWYSESQVFTDLYRVINYESIKKLTDNNHAFWSSFEDIVLETIKSMDIDELTNIYKDKKYTY
jgi:hypothetical protein